MNVCRILIKAKYGDGNVVNTERANVIMTMLVRDSNDVMTVMMAISVTIIVRVLCICFSVLYTQVAKLL